MNLVWILSTYYVCKAGPAPAPNKADDDDDNGGGGGGTTEKSEEPWKWTTNDPTNAQHA
jgi:hypothetical protein